MDNQLLKTTITILSVTGKVTKTNRVMFKIKGSDNKTYQLWQNKSDGTESKAFETLKTLNDNGLRKTVDISYKEDKGEYEGKTIIYRTIVMLYPSNENADNDTKSSTENLANITEEFNTGKVLGMSFESCKHDYLLEAYKAGKELLTAEDEVETWAAASMRMMPKIEKVTDNKPPENFPF